MVIFNSKAILGEHRTQWIDYDKGISIILVGYGHAFAVLQGHGTSFENYPFLNYIGVFLYGFRMPLFFIISGMLLGKSLQRKGVRGYLYNRVNNILHPLLVWGIIEITIKLASAGEIPSLRILLADYLNLLIDPRKTGVFWYLNALFCIGIIYSIVKTKLALNTSHQLVVGLLFFCLSAYIHINGYSAGFLTDIFEYYLFFAIGDYISKLMLSEKGKAYFTSPRLYIPLFLVFVTLQYYATQINLGSGSAGMVYVEKRLPFLFLAQALLGCAISVSFSFMLEKHKKLVFLRVVGFHSLFIYCMQIIVMNFSRIALVNQLGIKEVLILFPLIWFLGIAIPIITYNCCIRWRLWWLFTLRRPDTLNKSPLVQAKTKTLIINDFYQ
jgi:fucose 4-O-acetylase-like acetyltransferase